MQKYIKMGYYKYKFEIEIIIQQIKLMDPRPYHYEYRKPRLSNPTYKSNNLYQSIYHFGSYNLLHPNMDKIPNNSYAHPGDVNHPRHHNLNDFQKDQTRQKLQRQLRKIDPYYQNLSLVKQKNRPHEFSRNFERSYVPNTQLSNKYNQMRQVQDFTPPKQQKLNSNGYVDIKNTSTNESLAKELPKPEVSRQSQRQFKQYPRSYSQDVNKSTLRQQQQDSNYLSNYGSRLMKSLVRRQDQDFIYQRQQKPYNILNCYPKQVVNTHRAYPKYTLQHHLIQTGQYPRVHNPQY